MDSYLIASAHSAGLGRRESGSSALQRWIQCFADINSVRGQVGAAVEDGGVPQTISGEIVEREQQTRKQKRQTRPGQLL